MDKNLIHSTAIVEGEVGDGTRVWGWSHIMEGAKVGTNCNIGEHCFIESGAVVGDNCIIKNGVCIWDKVVLDDGVFVASGTVFTNEKYTRSGYKREWENTYLRKGVTIGAGAIVLCGITIGEYATVGAGTFVLSNVKSQALVYGNPAHQHGWVCICGLKLSSKEGLFHCECGLRYILENVSMRLLREDKNEYTSEA